MATPTDEHKTRADVSRKPKTRGTSRRLSSEDRREQFIEQATRLFAEQGFSANTRDLSKLLGTTQPLLYKYFPSKELLIDAVLERMVQDRAKLDWSSILNDRTVPLRARLVEIFSAYAYQTYERDWIRLYMFAGLAGGELNRRYIARVTEPMLKAVAREIRFDLKIQRPRSHQDSNIQLEYLWVFHGALYYSRIRRHIYGMEENESDRARVVEVMVDQMIDGFPKLFEPEESSGPSAPADIPARVDT